MNVDGSLKEYFEHALSSLMKNYETESSLSDAMRYALESGGKRIRPLLLLSILKALDSVSLDRGLRTAMALEFIHTYSLIHDDLPAMDDDAVRRGRASSHVKFGEALAILSGDALLTEAFGLIADDPKLPATVRLDLIADLSRASGAFGMVEGQSLDIEGENRALTLNQLQDIHSRKTGALFLFAGRAAGMIANADSKVRENLEVFAQFFGLAFQIHNDLKNRLQIGQEDQARFQSDIEHHKATYPAILGLEAAIDELYQVLDSAQASLNQLKQSSQDPRSLDQISVWIDQLRIKL
ncbi:MAG: polyprenyl synthetase family protein [Facklamia hominis]|uniref:polyprenyl synthetase family protein n=1 Tax=Facklamia hominis TaxID=178214 RepID=UPI000C7B8367|nr:farnesyl diphosphate synthase [Facklamia hominis]PKY92623.1 polyprenyl synthetase family protein [Facklamia hominis]WPJ90187.1 polyprenyl synthetase family protein [Facklamia hominis]